MGAGKGPVNVNAKPAPPTCTHFMVFTSPARSSNVTLGIGVPTQTSRAAKPHTCSLFSRGRRAWERTIVINLYKKSTTAFHFQEVTMEMHKPKCALEPVLSDLFSLVYTCPSSGTSATSPWSFFSSKVERRHS